MDEFFPWGCPEIIKSISGQVHYLVKVDEFIIKSIGGRVHQSRHVHPSYLPSPFRGQVHPNIYAQRWTDIHISKNKDQHIAKNMLKATDVKY